MRFSFTLTRDDWLAFTAVAGRHVTELARAKIPVTLANIAIWIPLGIGGAAFIGIYNANPSISSDLAVLAVFISLGIALLTVSLWLRQRWFARFAFAEDGILLNETTIDAGPEQIEMTTAHTYSRYSWSAIRHVDQDEKNLYLFIDNAQALILPKDAMDSEDWAAQIRSWAQ